MFSLHGKTLVANSGADTFRGGHGAMWHAHSLTRPFTHRNGAPGFPWERGGMLVALPGAIQAPDG
ncbi:MAG: hypothetical protein WA797_00940 [Acidimicrobiales bacterium]